MVTVEASEMRTALAMDFLGDFDGLPVNRLCIGLLVLDTQQPGPHDERFYQIVRGWVASQDLHALIRIAQRLLRVVLRVVARELAREAPAPQGSVIVSAIEDAQRFGQRLVALGIGL